jgi:phage gp29-like protein
MSFKDYIRELGFFKETPKNNEIIVSQGSHIVEVENPRNIYSLYTEEFSNLSAEKVKYYLESARKGINFWKSLLFEEIRRRDNRIGAVCQTRKLALAGKEWGLEYPDRSVEDGIIKEMKANLSGINITNFITDIIEAQIQGVSTFEINYKYSSGRITVDEVVYLPNHILMYDDVEDKYYYLSKDKADSLTMRSATANSVQDRVDVRQYAIKDEFIDPLKILEVHSFDGNAANGFMNGCIDSIIWSYLFKNYGVKDWAIFLEKFATPSIIGKFDPLMNKEDRNTLYNAVKNYGNLFKAIIPNSADILVQSDANKQSSSDIYLSYVEWWNEEITIRVLGQNLTTQISEGSRAAAQVHDKVRGDILKSDMKLVEMTINELIKRLIDLNYPSVKAYPEFRFVEDEDLSYKDSKAKIYQTLFSMGHVVSAEQIEREFGVVLSADKSNENPNDPASMSEDNTERRKIMMRDAESEKVIDQWLDDIFNKVKSEEVKQ